MGRPPHVGGDEVKPKRIPVWVEGNFPDEEFTDDTFTAMAEEVHLERRKDLLLSKVKMKKKAE